MRTRIQDFIQMKTLKKIYDIKQCYNNIVQYMNKVQNYNLAILNLQTQKKKINQSHFR